MNNIIKIQLVTSIKDTYISKGLLLLILLSVLLTGCSEIEKIDENFDDPSNEVIFEGNNYSGDGPYEQYYIEFPFDETEIDNIEVFMYIVPNVTQYKKIVTKFSDIEKIYNSFKNLCLKGLPRKETICGTTNLCFRFNIKNNTAFEVSYWSGGGYAGVIPMNKNKLYYTSPNLDFCWYTDDLDYEIIEASDEKLPMY